MHIYFRRAQVPVGSSAGEFSTEPQLLKDFLMRQINGPIRWERVMKRLYEEAGIFICVGPGKDLKRFISQYYLDKSFYIIENSTELKDFKRAIREEVKENE